MALELAIESARRPWATLAGISSKAGSFVEGPPDVDEVSVAGIIRVIDGMTPAQNGQFLDYKDGRVIPW